MAGPGVNPDDPDTSDRVRAARVEVARALGQAVADKATPRFCLTFARRSAPEGVRVEFEDAGERGVRVIGGAPPAIIEFVGDREQPASVTPEAVRGPRASAVASARTAAYQVIGGVYAEVERLSTGPLRGVRMAGGEPAVSALLNQVCWLNRTVRTFAHPLALAEVAADASVQSLDVPRRLRAEAADPNMEAIGYPAWLRANKGMGQDVIVAVIDSEVALRHPALQGRVVQRRNFTDEGWGSPHAHGTAVAGIIGAASAEHGGVAPGVVLYNYKVLAGPVSAEDFAGTTAIQLALEDGAAVANCSWGTGPAGDGTSREARAVDEAWRLGMVVVKSAGNDGPGAATMTSPADADGVIAVGATDVDGEAVADYSSRGPVAGRPGPHLVAPGGTHDIGVVTCHPGGGFAPIGPGTSFAAPHVSGMVALLAEAHPDWEPDDIRRHLLGRVLALSDSAPGAQGAGLAQL